MPTLSVVIPAYDAAATVAAAAASATAQQDVDVEVIVVDDGSHDETGAVAAALPGVVVARQSNAGPAAARNHGLRLATGDFIGFLDADDRLLPGWGSAVVTLLQAGADIAVTDTLIADAATGAIISSYGAEVPFPSVPDQRRRILTDNFLQSTAGISRAAAESTGGLDEGLRGVEDWDLWMRIILAGGTAARDPRALSVYTRGQESISSDRLAMTRQEIALLTKCAALGLEPGLERARQRSLRQRRGRLALLDADAGAAAGKRAAAAQYARAAVALRQPRLLVRSAATAAAPEFAAAHGSRARRP